MTVYENIRYWRKLRKLTQDELAQKAGTTYNTISRIERFKQSPSYDMVESIAKALGVTVAHLSEISSPIGGSVMTDTEPRFTQIDKSLTMPLLKTIPFGAWKGWRHDGMDSLTESFVAKYDLDGDYLFAVRVADSSMSPELCEGDVLIINPATAFYPHEGGRIGVVVLPDKHMIRRVHLTPDRNNYLLEPLNKLFHTEVLPVTGTIIYKIVELRPKRDHLF